MRGSRLVALTLLATTACSAQRGTGAAQYVPGSGPVVQIAPDDREAALDFSGTTLEGDVLGLAALRGRPVVVNVWWSGCGPCRKEMPLLNEVARTTQAHFLGINIRDVSAENARAFERDVAVEYPSLYPGDGLLLRFGSYTPAGVPTTVVLDSDGRVAAVVPGGVTSTATLEGLIADASTS